MHFRFPQTSSSWLLLFLQQTKDQLDDMLLSQSLLEDFKVRARARECAM